MNKVTVILFHGVLLLFVEVVLTFASQQVEGEGNYIVPRTTLELSTNTNRSAEGHKRICTSNLDCESYTNNQCCQTVSGYYKCRKRCRPRKKPGKFRTGNKRRLKNNNKNKKKMTTAVTLGCVVGSNIYKEGDVVQAEDGCNDCICKKGKMICTERHCPPGKPLPLIGKCTFKGKLYDDRYHLVLHNGCKRCICQYSLWNCTIHPCVKVNVKQPTSSTVSILSSVFLALVCSIIHFLWLT